MYNNLNTYINKKAISISAKEQDSFVFNCAKNCWGTCCIKENVGMLHLSIYDVYRLQIARKNLAVLEIVDVKIDEKNNLPRAFIKWTDEGTCPNLGDEGLCQVYKDRPYACRIFPLQAKFIINDETKEVKADYSVREKVCYGFHKEANPQKQLISSFLGEADVLNLEKFEIEEIKLRDSLQKDLDLKNLSKEKLLLLAQSMYCLREKIYMKNKYFMDAFSETLKIPKRIKKVESFTAEELTNLAIFEFVPRMIKYLEC